MRLGKPLLDTLDRICCGGVVLDASGHALQINRTAENILKELSIRGRTAQLSRQQVSDIISRLLLSKARTFTLSKHVWSSVQRNGKRDLLFHTVKLEEGSEKGHDRVLILVDLDLSPILNPVAVKEALDLTAAEGEIAKELATGKPLAQIADARGISIATGRTQLASIFAKTRTRRQAELVALLTRISILP
jgi:DNA-binding CsgD family transcriptional regulator